MSDEKTNSIPPELSGTIAELVRKELENYIIYSGVGNKNQIETLTNFNQTDSERVLRGKSNSLIVLGKDRPLSEGSGKGGVGYDQASCIDIIAGHMGSRPIDAVNGVKILSNKNFVADSARVYVSQFCDLDKYFGIPNLEVVTGENGNKTKLNINDSRSGVGIKADTVCVVARENIKLCTSFGEPNSRNDAVHPAGISIIAGIDRISDSLIPQPMVKGNSLIAMTKKIIKSIDELQSNVQSFIDKQTNINSLIMEHKHQLEGTNTTGSPLNKESINKIRLQIDAIGVDILGNRFKQDAIEQAHLVAGKKESIISSHNMVN
jgi:hypothetical protein